MKNLAFAGLGLIIVLVIVFFFSAKANKQRDTLIPSPQAVETPAINLQGQNKEASTSAKKMYNKAPEVLPKEKITGKKIRIKTAKGDIVFQLFDDTPIASSNFLFLTREKFYNGLIFHRREERFVIQGGDPSGNGTGSPGYTFPDEKVTRDYKRGIVAMANAGPNTNGSQFFIMLADTPLPKNYTIFGQVNSGMDVVDQIIVGDAMESVTVE